MNTAYLVVFKDYPDNQKGFELAVADGAIHNIDANAQSYSTMGDIQNAINTTGQCLGFTVNIGIVKDTAYISMAVIDDTERNSQLDYDDLETAFYIGLSNLKHAAEQIAVLRANVDDALKALSDSLPDGNERDTVDHCIDCIDQYNLSQLKP